VTAGRAYPSVSIIVLNFNGLAFLEPCLSSLEQLDYPEGRFEVILVDNASTDSSVAFVRKRFPWVRIIQNDRNLGFAGGNNVGIRVSKGEYIALLNNDTKVERDWLIELVKGCEADRAIGACTSKIWLFDDRLRIRLTTVPFRPIDVGVSRDPRELGVLIEEAIVRRPEGTGRVEWAEGFYPEDRYGGRAGRWSRGEAIVSIPVAPTDSRLMLELRMSSPRPGHPGGTPVSLWVDDRRLAMLTVGYSPSLFRVLLESDVLEHARPVIQNAGSVILPDGSGRDRGALVRNGQQVFEEDCGQYDRVEEVFAACGAGALFRRAMLEDVGLLDDYFFMYYEDTDLCWRARLRGWKIMYSPHAVMRHVHCGTSIEWSPAFLFYTYRNRLAMLLKNAPITLAAREWVAYMASVSVAGVGICGRRLLTRANGQLVCDLRQRLRALGSLLTAIPDLYSKRRSIQSTRRVSHDVIIRWMRVPPEA